MACPSTDLHTEYFLYSGVLYGGSHRGNTLVRDGVGGSTRQAAFARV